MSSQHSPSRIRDPLPHFGSLVLVGAPMGISASVGDPRRVFSEAGDQSLRNSEDVSIPFHAIKLARIAGQAH